MDALTLGFYTVSQQAASSEKRGALVAARVSQPCHGDRHQRRGEERLRFAVDSVYRGGLSCVTSRFLFQICSRS